MTLADDGELERQLHQRFAPLRLRGEWFRPEQELAGLAMVARTAPTPTPATAESLGRRVPDRWGRRMRARHREPAAAAELADDLIRVRFMQRRRWDPPLATPAA